MLAPATRCRDGEAAVDEGILTMVTMRARTTLERPSRAMGLLVSVFMAVVTTIAVSPASAHPSESSSWGAPVNAESVPGTSADLNTPSLDGCPIVSPDGLRLYFASSRPGGLGGLDIWVAARPNRDAAFGTPANVGAPVNTAADDFCPSPMADGWFFFVSTRAPGCGSADIYVTRRIGRERWLPPSHLGCHVNSAGQEASPYLVSTHGRRNSTLLYFSSDRAGGFAPDAGTPDADIYVSELTNFGFGPAVLVEDVNTAANDARPNLRRNGLEMVFDSTRAGGLGGADIYAASRGGLDEPWSTPSNLSTVNSAANESRASFSPDGKMLYFGSNRPGSELGADGRPSSDIYVANRQTSSSRRSAELPNLDDPLVRQLFVDRFEPGSFGIATDW